MSLMIDDDLIKPGPLVMPELEFRCPDCPWCGVELNPTDGAFECESCGASWGERGYADRSSRPCVEGCCTLATVIGDDGQPRCAKCVADIAANLIEPTAPMECLNKYCHRIIYGRTLDAQGRRHGQLCAPCGQDASFKERYPQYKTRVSA